MAEGEINAFLANLALKEWVSASTQTQALSAIVFLGSEKRGKKGTFLIFPKAEGHRFSSWI